MIAMQLATYPRRNGSELHSPKSLIALTSTFDNQSKSSWVLCTPCGSILQFHTSKVFFPHKTSVGNSSFASTDSMISINHKSEPVGAVSNHPRLRVRKGSLPHRPSTIILTGCNSLFLVVFDSYVLCPTEYHQHISLIIVQTAVDVYVGTHLGRKQKECLPGPRMLWFWNHSLAISCPKLQVP